MSYENPALYILGIHTMVVALIAFLWVSEIDGVDAGEKMSFVKTIVDESSSSLYSMSISASGDYDREDPESDSNEDDDDGIKDY